MSSQLKPDPVAMHPKKLITFPPPRPETPQTPQSHLKPECLIPPMKKMRMTSNFGLSCHHRHSARSTARGLVPTWGQIKALTGQAENLVIQQGVVTPLHNVHCYFSRVILPVIKLLFRGIQQVRIELATLRLKNKKGGDAGSQFSTRHSPWAFSTCCGDCSARRSIEWHL
ncbi:uncharacterized protein LOC119543321 isoform X2 [Choloepus didactylus]|uniref:uncharacterized protein LOC119543321 isoform X2 n=1 Tax=Choloepus didactylus TaxID=27675 RepID=UPI00189CD0C9|nr:uncharacterized protein LOC119543321 isoform X2 [Choloepus didactylus]